MSAYSGAVNTLEPTAYWRRGEASGPTSEDETGDHDGTYENGPTLGESSLIHSDPDNDCVLQDSAAREHVRVPHHADLELGATFTIKAWVKFTSAENQACAVGKISTSTWKGYLMGVNYSGNKAYLWTRDTSAVWLEATAALNDGEPHMIVATLSGGTGKIYVDGGAAENSASMQTPGANTVDLYIGERYDDGHTLTGHEDEVAVWKGKALSQSEVQGLYDTAWQEKSTEFKVGSCTARLYYNASTLRVIRMESGDPGSCELAFKVVEDEGETWEDSFTEAGSISCPYEMYYTDEGSEGIGSITVTLEMKKG